MKELTTIAFVFFAFCLFGQTTNWDEIKLKEHWKKNGANEIEGIYENLSKSFDDSKWKFGLIKIDNSNFQLIYLGGVSIRNNYNWKIGDIKSYLSKTASNGLYKIKWLQSSSREICEDGYITFQDGGMNLIWTNEFPNELYIKLFPFSSDNSSINPEQPYQSSGTGFAISSDALIVTNYHVINGAVNINVRGINGDFLKTYKAKVVVVDKNNDLAVIKIEEEGFSSLGIIPYVIPKKSCDVGCSVFCLGYPLRATMGDEVKLTNGIISSKSGFQGDITAYQISAPVQPGNSGGPLFDDKGNLIGIINAKHLGVENVSYAIKVTFLLNLLDIMTNPPTLQTINNLTGKPLTEQVKIVKKFTYIIETN